MLSDDERISPKVVVGRASKAVGGHKVLAADSRLVLKGAEAAAQRVSEYANVSTLAGERIVPIDVAVEFDRVLMANGLPPMNIANAASLLGLRLVPEQDVAEKSSVHADFCVFARDSGEALAAAGQVADDADSDVERVRNAIRAVDEAVQAGIEMRELLKLHLVQREVVRP